MVIAESQKPGLESHADDFLEFFPFSIEDELYLGLSADFNYEPRVKIED